MLKEPKVELTEFAPQKNNEVTTASVHPQSDTKTISDGETSLNKSRITHSLVENFGTQMDLAIEELEKDHYLYRRGSTQVHVEAYAASTADDIMNDNKFSRMLYNGLKLISALVGMLLLIITLTLKMSSAITDQMQEIVLDQYDLALFTIGSLWCFYYLFKGIFRNKDNLKFLKSHRSSNRWLKGVIVLFGLGIILKNGLTFISYLMVEDLSICSDNNFKIAVAAFQALFIVAQTKYIFQFSKAYIRNCNAGSSTGLMLMIAINLSTWISAVIQETLHALHIEHGNQAEGTTHSSYPNSTKKAGQPEHYAGSNQGDSSVCDCNSSFCEVASEAETFLFPFLIEYSLVASCLLFVIWDNVGKTPPPCEGVVKPSFKFYGHYKGSSAATFVLFLTTIFLILLGTSGTTASFKTYFTEILQLNIYMGFLATIEFSMLIATLWGFYLFYRICRPLEKGSMLDQVLLIVCVTGPFVFNIFSMIAIITGSSNKETLWELSLLYPLVDQLQCFFQLIFILYGLKREPITSTSAKETAAQLKHGIRHEHSKHSNEDQSSEAEFDNKTFIRSRRNSMTSVVTRLATAHVPSTPPTRQYLSVKDTQSFPNLSDKAFHSPEIVVSPSKDAPKKSDDDQPSTSDQGSVETNNEYKQTIFKIVSEMHVARPDTLRFYLRDVMVFLLGANACLWLFMSLEGTAFTVFLYGSEFFGPSAWTIIKMLCRPLSIFFRMHSAGCLFEMWSFA